MISTFSLTYKKSVDFGLGWLCIVFKSELKALLPYSVSRDENMNMTSVFSFTF